MRLYGFINFSKMFWSIL